MTPELCAVEGAEVACLKGTLIWGGEAQSDGYTLGCNAVLMGEQAMYTNFTETDVQAIGTPKSTQTSDLKKITCHLRL